MENNVLRIEISDHARIPYLSLGPEDRRNIDVWLDQLRNWRNDEFLRSKAKRLRADEEFYIVDAGDDLFIAFEIADDKLKLYSIYSRETLRKFGVLPEQSAV
jgi:hypothetical protein